MVQVLGLKLLETENTKVWKSLGEMAFRVGKQLVSIVTGGASGLGRATAERFVKLGAKVSILDLPESDGYDVATELGKENCIFCPCDVTNTDDVNVALETTVGKFGSLQAVINCAAVGGALFIYHFRDKEPHNFELFQKIMDTKVSGTFNVTRCAVPELAKNDPGGEGQRGIIINTSGTTAFDGQQGSIAYAGACHAVSSMTLPLARDLSGLGIRVASIAPGYFDTPLVNIVPEKIVQFLGTQVPFPARLGNPDEYAQLAQTIIENPMINGEVIRLDGAMRTAF